MFSTLYFNVRSPLILTRAGEFYGLPLPAVLSHLLTGTKRQV